MAAKIRPCLVISIPPKDDDRALVTLVPHTTALRGSAFECSLAISFLKPGAFDAQGLVTVPHVKLLKKLGKLDPQQLSQIERVLKSWLGFSG